MRNGDAGAGFDDRGETKAEASAMAGTAAHLLDSVVVVVVVVPDE